MCALEHLLFFGKVKQREWVRSSIYLASTALLINTLIWLIYPPSEVAFVGFLVSEKFSLFFLD